MTKTTNTAKIRFIIMLLMAIALLLLGGCTTEIESKDHVHLPAASPEVPATCLTGGLSEGSYCLTCGEILIQQQPIPSLGHSEVIDPEVAATCSSTGLTEGSHCAVCGEIIVYQTVIPKSEHSFGENVSCDEDQTCTVCGTVIKSEGGHAVVVDDEIKATCTTDGKTEGSHCAVCGEVIKKQETVKALGHIEVTTPEIPATCESAGKTEGSSCSVCGKVIVAQEVIPATGHSEVTDPAFEPTCGNPGYTQGSHCEKCGKEIIVQEEIPAPEHDIVEDPEVPATCSENGLTRGEHCAACGEILVPQVVTFATGHWVVFQDWDGSVLREEQVPCGGSATPPYDPYRSGYIFNGWSHDYTNVTEDLFIQAIYFQISDDPIIPDTPVTPPGSDNNAPTDGSPYVEVTTVIANAGDKNVAVDIIVRNSPGITTMAVSVEYSAGLTLTNVVFNDQLGGFSIPPQEYVAPATLLWLNGSNDISGDFLLATLYFDVGYTDQSELSVSIRPAPDMAYSLDETPISLTTVSGCVAVR